MNSFPLIFNKIAHQLVQPAAFFWHQIFNIHKGMDHLLKVV